MAARLKSRTAVVLALLAALVVAGLGARATLRAFDPTPWGRLLEGRLRETGAALHARVATLAELPTLAAAVATDARTVRDLTQDELAFRPRHGETVAIGQLPKGRPPVLLLLLPERAEAPPLAQAAGPVVRIVAGTTVVISEAIRVVPRERGGELEGVVAASQEVPLADLSRKLAVASIGARVTMGRQTLELGAMERAREPRTKRFKVAVDSPGDAPITLTLMPPPQTSGRPYWIGAGALFAAALLLAARRGRDWDDDRAAAQTPTVWTPTGTLPIGGALDGTPPRLATPVAPTTAAPTPPSVLIGATGRRIGRYNIIQHIGTGGMADVYLAHATGEAGFTKKIALKVLDRSFARQPELVEHFLDEARLASLLDHPNIVHVIDLGRADDEYFIAMEYIDGADLARLIEITSRRRVPIPLSVVVAILRKVCDGLHAAHTARAADGASLGLVHRDMKCGNVFVARNGVVKVGDFGIAMTNHASRVTRTQIGLVKGTPGYMAPEHRLGHPIDGRADMYGVGAIAYELLTGVLVNLDVTMLAHRGRVGWPHLAPLARCRADVPAELERVIFRCLSYDATDRFSDCAALELALEEIARRHPPVAGDKIIARWIETTLAMEFPVGLAASPPAPFGP